MKRHDSDDSPVAAKLQRFDIKTKLLKENAKLSSRALIVENNTVSFPKRKQAVCSFIHVVIYELG